MKSPVSPRSVVARAGNGGGRADGMAHMKAEFVSMSNQRESREMAVNPEVIGASLRSAVESFAVAIINAVPKASRSQGESDFLQDVRRGRRELNEENLTRLFVLASRSNQCINALDESLRALAGRVAAAQPIECVYDLSEQEIPLDAEGDLIRAKLAREKSRTRLEQLAEFGPKMIAYWRRLTDAANHSLARHHA